MPSPDRHFANAAIFTQSTGVTPNSGDAALYIKTDNKLYVKNSLGEELLLDAPINKFVTANQDVTNSNTLTDSTDLQVSLLASATYDFQTMELIGASAFASSGARSLLAYTGTATWYGQRRRNSASNVEPVNVSATWGGSGEAVNGQASHPSQSLLVERFGRIVTTTAGTLKIQFAQDTAVSGQYARLLVGSFLKVQRVS